jgi:hypothetical protein
MKLLFDDAEHRYTDELGNVYTSVTTVLHDYIPKFNKEYWLKRKADELGVTQRELDQRWIDINKESTVRGNAKHNALEDGIKEHSKFKNAIKYLKNRDDKQLVTIYDIDSIDSRVKPLDITGFIQATDGRYPAIYEKFTLLANEGYKIYSEIGCYNPHALISGTIDVPCMREDGFAILDWKTNKDGIKYTSGYFRKDKKSTPHQLTDRYVQTADFMRPPLNHLPDCNFYHYAMQLSLYAYTVEGMLQLPCKGLRLCHIQSPFILNKYGMPLADERGMYTIDPKGHEVAAWHHVPYLRAEAEAIIEDHKLKLTNTINREYQMFQ